MFRRILTFSAWLFLFSGLVFFVISSTNCTKTITEATYDTLIVHDTTTQNVFVCVLQSFFSVAELYSNPIANPSQSQTKLKWDTQERLFPIINVYPGYLYFGDTSEVLQQEQYMVELTSNVGDCSGSITMPGALSIIEPALYDTLPFNKSVYCEWSSAPGAEFYYILYMASGFDWQGWWIGDCQLKEEFVRSTSYTIPVSYFDVPGAAYYETVFFAVPCAGIFPESGALGNMSGSAIGFLTVLGELDYTLFYVGAPTFTTTHSGLVQKPDVTDAITSFVKALGIDRAMRQ